MSTDEGSEEVYVCVCMYNFFFFFFFFPTGRAGSSAYLKLPDTSVYKISFSIGEV